VNSESFDAFESLIGGWDGEQVVIAHLAEVRAWLFVCLHSRTLGPATGGTRLVVYPTAADGLRDGLRLAQAMTLKMAAAQLPCGGGKAVLAVPELPRGAARELLLARYADVIASLGGSFVTGPDVNTVPADMDVIAQRCPYVFCRTSAHGGSGDSGPHTARGVLHAIAACLDRGFASPALSTRTVLVQGAGSVGANLARLAAEHGARVLISDVDARRAAAVAAQTGAAIVDPAEVIGTECDVYAPCALGGTLTVDTIPRLRCRIVAGAANNQLAEPDDAKHLRDAGIVYAPDFVANAGGVLHAIGTERLGWNAADTADALAGIGRRLAEIFARSDRQDVSTEQAARDLATERLASPPESRPT
jgi:leucine dehydrogenase